MQIIELKESDYKMLKKMAWNIFKKTGNINTFIELLKLEDIEKNKKAESNGNSKDKGNNNFRK